jgi:hypothetical protein
MDFHIESQRLFRSSLTANEVHSPSICASHEATASLEPVGHSTSDQLGLPRTSSSIAQRAPILARASVVVGDAWMT